MRETTKERTMNEEHAAMVGDKDVLGHIRKINEERRAAWNGEGMLFTVSEDVAERYHNVYEYQWAMTYADYSDLYKERYGRRPHLHPLNYSLTDLETFLQNL
jgi:hypothetical protein